MERALPARWRLVTWTVALAVIGYWWLGEIRHPWIGDAHDYWLADLDNLYLVLWPGGKGSPYSPAFQLAMEPLRWLPWHAFYAVWTALLLGAAYWLIGPVLLAGFLLLPLLGVDTPVAHDIHTGNVHTLLALALVVGVSRPGAWSFMLLTKVSPAIGIGWYVLRRDWRAVRQIALVTGLIVLIAVVLLPAAWPQWIALLAGSVQHPRVDSGMVLPWPLMIRLALAAGIVALAAWRNVYWPLAFALTLALPAVWYTALAIPFLAMPRLVRASPERRNAPERRPLSRIALWYRHQSPQSES